MMPPRAAIDAQLERVLASEQFAGTSRLRRFLRFVVERSLAGEADRLKEYVIGIEVFDRDATYDPRVDSIVRVEAGRLRAKLEEYYRGVGSADPIVIRIQKGGYSPEYAEGCRIATAVERALPASATADSGGRGSVRAPEGRRRALRGGAIAAATLAGVGALAALWLAVQGKAPATAPAPALPAVAVLPFMPYSDEQAARVLATRLTEGVAAELVRLGRFAVVPSTTAQQYAEIRGSLQDVARELRAEFLLQARVLEETDAVRIELRWVDGPGNRKFWVQTIAGHPANVDDLARRLAASAAEALQPP